MANAPGLLPRTPHHEWVGMLRVTRVRLVVGPRRTTAFIEGYRHHRAVVEPVSLARAVGLTSRGVPVTLEHDAAA
jgi:hypothetical protein